MSKIDGKADIVVSRSGVLTWRGRDYRCAIGRSGIGNDKREGDGASPAGRFALRRVYFRPDRLAPPVTRLPVVALTPADGWCDDPGDPCYNRPVRLPYVARAETLWREDHVYDAIAVLGHNDDPPASGKGSAIFLHVARYAYAPTEGCVALALGDLLTVLRDCDPATFLWIGDDSL